MCSKGKSMIGPRITGGAKIFSDENSEDWL